MIKISMGRVKITKVGADLSCTSIRKELLSKLINTMQCVANTNLRKAVIRTRGRRCILWEAELATGEKCWRATELQWTPLRGRSLSGITHFWTSSQFCQESLTYPEFLRT